MLTGTLITVAGFMPVGFARSVAGEYTFSIFCRGRHCAHCFLGRCRRLYALSWLQDSECQKTAGKRRATWRRHLRNPVLPSRTRRSQLVCQAALAGNRFDFDGFCLVAGGAQYRRGKTVFHGIESFGIAG